MRFRTIAAGIAAVLIAGSAQAQILEDVLGPWHMNIDAAGQSFDVTIVFSMENNELAGIIRSDRGDAPATNVQLEGNQLSWTAQMGPAEFDLAVTVDGNTFAGTSETPFGPVVLKGTKFTAEEIAAMGAAYDELVGDWDTHTEFNGKTIESKLRVEVIDGQLMGSVLGGGGQVRPGDEPKQFLEYSEGKLRWDVQMPYVTQSGGVVEVTVDGNTFEGVISSEFGEIPISGELVDTTKMVASPYDDPSRIIGEWDTVAELGETETYATVIIEEVGERLEAYLQTEAGEFVADEVGYEQIGDDMGIIRIEVTIPPVSAEQLLFELIVDHTTHTFMGEEMRLGSVYLEGELMTDDAAQAPETAAVEEPAQPEGVTAAHIMGLLDRDNSGSISMEEAPEQLRMNFSMVDGNADGGIDATEAEIVAMFINGQYGGPGKSANQVIAEMLVGLMDSNADGVVSEDEIPEEMKEDFAAVDANNDGNVDVEEALVVGDMLVGAAESGSSELTGEMVLQMLDADGDGKISMEEAPDELKANFSMVDSNADGSIDVTEAEVIAMFLNAQNQ